LLPVTRVLPSQRHGDPPLTFFAFGAFFGAFTVAPFFTGFFFGFTRDAFASAFF